MGYFAFAGVAVMCYGTIDFCYKHAANAGCRPLSVLSRSTLVTALCCSLSCFGWLSKEFPLRGIILFACLDSSLFLIGTASKISALKHLPTAVVLPVTKMSAILVILISILVMNERPTFYQSIGLGLSVVTVLLIIKEVCVIRTIPKLNSGILFSVLSMLAVTGSMFTAKFASISVPKYQFMTVSYGMAYLLTNAILLHPWQQIRNPGGEAMLRPMYWRYAAIIGPINAIGFYCMLKSLESGPISLVQGILCLSMVPPILLSILVLKEKLTMRKSLIVASGVLSLILIKF